MSSKVTLVVVLVAFLCLYQESNGATTAAPRRTIRDYAQDRLCSLNPQLCANRGQAAESASNTNNRENEATVEKIENLSEDRKHELQQTDDDDDENSLAEHEGDIDNALAEGGHNDEVEARSRRRRGNRRRGRKGRKGGKCKGKKCRRRENRRGRGKRNRKSRRGHNRRGGLKSVRRHHYTKTRRTSG